MASTLPLVLAFGLLPVGQPEASGAPSSQVVDVTAGFDGHYRIGRWLPVRVTIENRGDDVEGELVVEWGGAVFVQEISLPSPSRKRVEFYVRGADARDTLALRLSSRDAVIGTYEVSVRGVPPAEPLTLVVSDDLPGRSPPDAEAGGVVARVALGALPESWRGYDGVDRVVWDRPRPELLTVQQRQALMRWQALGGPVVSESPLPVDASRAGSLAWDREVLGGSPVALTPDFQGPATRVGLFLLAYVAVELVVLFGMPGVSLRVWSTPGATIGIALGFSAAAWLLGSFVNSGAIVVREWSVIHRFPDIEAAYVSTYGALRAPSRRHYELGALSPDAFFDRVETTRSAHRMDNRFSEQGAASLSGRLNMAESLAFAVQGFAEIPLPHVEEAGPLFKVSNTSPFDLRHCSIAVEGGARLIPILAPKQTIEVRRAHDRAAETRTIVPTDASTLLARVRARPPDSPVMTCGVSGGVPNLKSDAPRASTESSTVLVYHLPGRRPQG